LTHLTVQIWLSWPPLHLYLISKEYVTSVTNDTKLFNYKCKNWNTRTLHFIESSPVTNIISIIIVLNLYLICFRLETRHEVHLYPLPNLTDRDQGSNPPMHCGDKSLVRLDQKKTKSKSFLFEIVYVRNNWYWKSLLWWIILFMFEIIGIENLYYDE
jgi:hypothetical protein